MVPVLVVLMIVAFIAIDLLIRYFTKRMREAKERKERLAALDIGLRLDFTNEAKSLKRVEVPRSAARILAVDDEAIVLDCFRKILVAAGYAIDTVESGREITRPVIEAGKDLKVLVRAGIGLDNIDSAAANEKGIAVANTPAARPSVSRSTHSA